MRAEINRDQMNDVQLMVKGVAVNGPKVLSRSLNKTATKARTVSSKKIREQVSLKAAYVNSKLKIKRATWKNLTAKLEAEKRGVLMTRYPHTLLKSGIISVKIKKTGRRAKLSGAFKTTIRAGGKTVDVIAVRDPEGGRYSTGNSKFKVLYSPSVSQVFSSVRDQVDDDMSVYLLNVTEQELNAVMRGY